MRLVELVLDDARLSKLTVDYDSRGRVLGDEKALACERCRREVGASLVRCDERVAGRYPFLLSAHTLTLPDRLGLLTTGTLLFILFAPSLFFSVWAVALIALVYTVLYAFFSKRLALYHSKRGISWQRGTFLGRQTWQARIARGEKLKLAQTPFNSSLPSRLGALVQPRPRVRIREDLGVAVAVGEATLIGLLALGDLVAYEAAVRSNVSPRSNGSPPHILVGACLWNLLAGSHPTSRLGKMSSAYILTRPPDRPTSVSLGKVEDRVIETIRDWRKASYTELWPLPPTAYLASRTVLRRGWLGAAVREDAATRGLVKRSGWSVGPLSSVICHTK